MACGDTYDDGVHPVLVLGFGLAVAPLVLTPGASFTLTVSYSVDGPGAVRHVIAGTGLGIVTHGVLAAVGLAAVVMRSSEAYRLIQTVGAIYLVFLGLALLVSKKRLASIDHQPVRRFDLMRDRGPLATAYLANVLNPKAAGVYLTLAPQFLPAHSVNLFSMSVLAGTHVVIMAIWLAFVGLMLSAVSQRTATDRAIQALRRAGGVILIALGLRSTADALV